MQPKNGTDYAQNYDIIVKWLAPALRGETLDVIGVKTGKIVDVFGFEPTDIKVAAGRVDVMLRDDAGELYHIEEERNLTLSDMYRFGAYHFMGAGQFGERITDVILASGDVYAGEKVVETRSGRYAPVVVDFTERDGPKRLAEIRAAAAEGTFGSWLELVFLPLYGKEKGEQRGELVEAVIRFETELVKARKISPELLAATLIMSNKLIDKNRIKELWEEIKMLDVLEVAREKGIEEGRNIGIKEGKSLGIKEGKSLGIEEGKSLGIEEGKSLGIEEGKKENAREMLRVVLFEKFGVAPLSVSERINRMEDRVALESLVRQVFRCEDFEAFEKMLDRLES